MAAKRRLEFAVVELGGVAYAVLREAQVVALCQRARVQPVARGRGATGPLAVLEHAEAPLAQRIRQRRRAAGLTQAALASVAGIRTETLNRIERGKTEPDFGTVRKLAAALRRVEAGPNEAPCEGGASGRVRSRETRRPRRCARSPRRRPAPIRRASQRRRTFRRT